MTETAAPANVPSATETAFSIIAAIGFCHMLNDMMQSLITGLYPMLKSNYALSFGQIGLMTLTFQFTASLLQPVVGIYTDRHPQPYSLTIGMGFTLSGLLLLANVHSYPLLLIACGLIGMGSSVFHPESSRVARMASGGRHGLAQSLFQVGGNFGSALGPLLAAFIVLPNGQKSVAWFSAAALIAMIILWQVGNWYARQHRTKSQRIATPAAPDLPKARIVVSIAVLLVLVFSKFIYTASLSSYYTLYTIHKFGISIRASQLLLFIYLGAMAVGTIAGGPIGDRIGRKRVIWASILGVLPFSLLLPYANFFWTPVLTVIIGLVLSSAFPAIIVFAQELAPRKVGLVAGMFFGFAFGMGGVGAAVLGQIADARGIDFVYRLCSFLPAFGLFAIFLPSIEGPRSRKHHAAS